MKTHLTVPCFGHVCFTLWKQNIKHSSTFFFILLTLSFHFSYVSTVLYSISDLPMSSQLMAQDNNMSMLEILAVEISLSA